MSLLLQSRQKEKVLKNSLDRISTYVRTPLAKKQTTYAKWHKNYA